MKLNIELDTADLAKLVRAADVIPTPTFHHIIMELQKRDAAKKAKVPKPTKAKKPKNPRVN